MVYLEANRQGYICFTNRSRNIRWGNCRPGEVMGAYRKYLEDKLGTSQDLDNYKFITTEPLLFWGNE